MVLSWPFILAFLLVLFLHCNPSSVNISCNQYWSTPLIVQNNGLSPQSPLKHCRCVVVSKQKDCNPFFYFSYLHYVVHRKIEQKCFQASAISEMKFPPRCRSRGNFRKQMEITTDALGIFLAKFSRGLKVIPFVTEGSFMSSIYFCSPTTFKLKIFHILW